MLASVCASASQHACASEEHINEKACVCLQFHAWHACLCMGGDVCMCLHNKTRISKNGHEDVSVPVEMHVCASPHACVCNTCNCKDTCGDMCMQLWRDICSSVGTHASVCGCKRMYACLCQMMSVCVPEYIVCMCIERQVYMHASKIIILTYHPHFIHHSNSN